MFLDCLKPTIATHNSFRLDWLVLDDFSQGTSSNLWKHGNMGCRLLSLYQQSGTKVNSTGWTFFGMPSSKWRKPSTSVFFVEIFDQVLSISWRPLAVGDPHESTVILRWFFENTKLMRAPWSLMAWVPIIAGPTAVHCCYFQTVIPSKRTDQKKRHIWKIHWLVVSNDFWCSTRLGEMIQFD